MQTPGRCSLLFPGSPSSLPKAAAPSSPHLYLEQPPGFACRPPGEAFNSAATSNCCGDERIFHPWGVCWFAAQLLNSANELVGTRDSGQPAAPGAPCRAGWFTTPAKSKGSGFGRTDPGNTASRRRKMRATRRVSREDLGGREASCLFAWMPAAG